MFENRKILRELGVDSEADLGIGIELGIGKEIPDDPAGLGFPFGSHRVLQIEDDHVRIALGCFPKHFGPVTGSEHDASSEHTGRSGAIHIGIPLRPKGGGRERVYPDVTRTATVNGPMSGATLLLWEGVVNGGIEGAQVIIETATGWPGVGIVFAYSFLIAFALPGPSEIVLVAPLDITQSRVLTLGIIVLTSAIGKAIGSLFAFHIGQEAKRSGPIIRWLERSRFDVISWSEKRTVGIARKYGYVGLGIAPVSPSSRIPSRSTRSPSSRRATGSSRWRRSSEASAAFS